jgi:hypothetical protein
MTSLLTLCPPDLRVLSVLATNEALAFKILQQGSSHSAATQKLPQAASGALGRNSESPHLGNRRLELQPHRTLSPHDFMRSFSK